MKKIEPYSWEELEQRRVALQKKVAIKELYLRKKMDRLFAAPPVESQLERMVSYAKAGYSLYDGFNTGFRLLRGFGLLFHRKKKK